MALLPNGRNVAMRLSYITWVCGPRCQMVLCITWCVTPAIVSNQILELLCFKSVIRRANFRFAYVPVRERLITELSPVRQELQARKALKGTQYAYAYSQARNVMHSNEIPLTFKALLL
ncbi:hypothetical protein CBL_05283 [Carabus blaptoides fortunei]